MRRRIVLFFVVTISLFVATIAIAQYPKTVRTEPLVMTGIPETSSSSTSAIPRSTLPFPKFVKSDALVMTGIPAVTGPTPAPFTPKFIKTEPLVMTGITTEGVK